MKAAALLYIIIRNFKYLFLDLLRVFLIIQAEILPRRGFVSDRLFEGVSF